MCGAWVKWIEEWTTFKKENPEYPILEIAYEDMKKVSGGIDHNETITCNRCMEILHTRYCKDENASM
jgi:hypothetical protein